MIPSLLNFPAPSFVFISVDFSNTVVWMISLFPWTSCILVQPFHIVPGTSITVQPSSSCSLATILFIYFSIFRSYSLVYWNSDIPYQIVVFLSLWMIYFGWFVWISKSQGILYFCIIYNWFEFVQITLAYIIKSQSFA